MADVGVGIRLEPRSWVRGRGIAGSRDGAIEAMFEVSEDCVRGQRRGSVQPRQMLTMSKANSVLRRSQAACWCCERRRQCCEAGCGAVSVGGGAGCGACWAWAVAVERGH
jgi:hypothetical protein